ncbi:hypothetical protein JTE90_005552 [Oedothorax gibbosus]|uniref:CUB domain-containing protein n=1 Tax=Oedothorax gibbosus TaxID=931172 RepID=A0AAV6VC16_9ARAC|nr:hypothetical protein JTE90_005552 [Oedothorax gibbosus]
MVRTPVLILCVLVFGNAFFQTESVLKTTFIEDLCYGSKTSEMDLRYDTSGILMGAPRGEGVDCEVVLNPPKNAHVVLSVYRYDLYRDDVLIIEDSDRHRMALIGYGVFRDEKKSVISEGKMRILYKTSNETVSLGKRAGFQFTYTKVMKSPCSSNEFKCANSYCILKNYVCDGHNHCGDSSDQKKCDSIRQEPTVDPGIPGAQRHSPTLTWVSLISIAALCVGSIVVITIIVLVRKANKKKNTKPGQIVAATSGNTEGGASSPPPAPSGTGNQLRTVSTTVPHQQVAQRASQLQSVSTPQETFYNRVRRSLRGQPRIENVPKERSPASPERPSLYPRVENIEMERKEVPESHHHQVPSMYPSLDQMPSAPEMFGIDNPEFKIEE